MPVKEMKLQESAAHGVPVQPKPATPPSSAFESIAEKLMFKILAYAPECARMLRETSKKLGKSVDKYAADPNIPLIEKMTFGNCRLPNTSTPASSFPFLHEAGRKTKFLFYRRLQLMTTQFRGKQYGEAFKEMIAMDEGNKPTLGCKRIAWDLNDEDFDEKANFVRECLGDRIGKVIVIWMSEVENIDGIAKLLSGKRVDAVKLGGCYLTNDIINNLRRFSTNHQVSTVELSIFEYTENSVELTKDMSKEVSEVLITPSSARKEWNLNCKQSLREEAKRARFVRGVLDSGCNEQFAH